MFFVLGVFALRIFYWQSQGVLKTLLPVNI